MFLSWKDASRQRTTSLVSVTNQKYVVLIRFTGTIPVLGIGPKSPVSKSVTYVTAYSIFANGEVTISHDYAFPDLPACNSYVAEIGSILVIKDTYEQLSWYGRGPGDTYNNRKRGNDVGVWKSTVTDKTFKKLFELAI